MSYLFRGILIGIGMWSGSAAFSQTVDGSALGNEIREKLSLLEAGGVSDITLLIRNWENELSIPANLEAGLEKHPNFKTSPGDFGYVVTDSSSGKILNIFNSNAPVIQDNSKLKILGYEGPKNSEVLLAAGNEWANARQKYLDEITKDARDSYAGRTIDEVAQKAQKATMTWAARLCPNFVYPSKVTLFLDAGFDFVVVDSKTGTEIEINMSEACSGLDMFLDDAIKKLSLQSD